MVLHLRTTEYGLIGRTQMNRNYRLVGIGTVLLSLGLAFTHANAGSRKTGLEGTAISASAL